MADSNASTFKPSSKGLILLTGATGFIGSHTAVELIEDGFDVLGVDNFYNSDPKVLNGINKIIEQSKASNKGRFYFEELDCTDLQAFGQVFDKYATGVPKEERIAEEGKGIVGAIHFAACKAVSESIEKALLYYRNNLVSLLNLIELMQQKAADANIVFSSSCTVYGQPSQENLPIKENAPLQMPLTPYGKTKQMAEYILQDCCRAFNNLSVCALRYFNPIGAHPSALIGELPRGVPQNLVPFITQTAAGIRECLSVFGDDYNTPDGSCIRDYIWVVDLAKAHVAALNKMIQKKLEPWSVFNIGTGKGTSVLELVNSFIKVTGVKLNYKIAPRREGDIEQVWADASKAAELLDWKADTPLDQVLLTAWRWQQTLR